MTTAESANPLLNMLNSVVPFARHVQILVTAADAEGAAAVLPDAPFLLNHVGSQHAGALYTLGEAASGAAMTAAFADLLGNATPLVRQATVRYLKVARGEIAAAARLNRPADAVRAAFMAEGKADFGIEVSLRDAGGTDVAVMDVEWSLRRRGG